MEKAERVEKVSETMKGYLVIDDVDVKEAEQIIKQLKKSGRWMSQEAMKKEMDAVGFAVLTHGLPAIQPYEIVEFKDGRKVRVKP
jgi:signal recognition particle GTPase